MFDTLHGTFVFKLRNFCVKWYPEKYEMLNLLKALTQQELCRAFTVLFFSGTCLKFMKGILKSLKV